MLQPNVRSKPSGGYERPRTGVTLGLRLPLSLATTHAVCGQPVQRWQAGGRKLLLPLTEPSPKHELGFGLGYTPCVTAGGGTWGKGGVP